jgi:hypothetical protein
MAFPGIYLDHRFHEQDNKFIAHEPAPLMPESTNNRSMGFRENGK